MSPVSGSTLHSPCPLQSSGHLCSEQSSPVCVLSQVHAPSSPQAPWSEQALGQVCSAQLGPRNPGLQAHKGGSPAPFGSAWHFPCRCFALHPSIQRLSHAAPPNSSSHTHTAWPASARHLPLVGPPHVAPDDTEQVTLQVAPVNSSKQLQRACPAPSCSQCPFPLQLPCSPGHCRVSHAGPPNGASHSQVRVPALDALWHLPCPEQRLGQICIEQSSPSCESSHSQRALLVCGSTRHLPLLLHSFGQLRWEQSLERQPSTHAQAPRVPSHKPCPEQTAFPVSEGQDFSSHVGPVHICPA